MEDREHQYHVSMQRRHKAGCSCATGHRIETSTLAARPPPNRRLDSASCQPGSQLLPGLRAAGMQCRAKICDPQRTDVAEEIERQVHSEKKQSSPTVLHHSLSAHRKKRSPAKASTFTVTQGRRQRGRRNLASAILDIGPTRRPWLRGRLEIVALAPHHVNRGLNCPLGCGTRECGLGARHTPRSVAM